MKFNAESHRKQAPIKGHSQRGVTLMTTMVMLVLVTLIGVSSIRASTMDEKMAGHSRDRDKAFQAAEAAVLTCLTQLKTETYTGTPLTPAAATETPLWEIASNWTNSNAIEIDLGIEARLAQKPRCMFEELGARTGSYRVTGRAVGASTLTVVMLQATYSIE